MQRTINEVFVTFSKINIVHLFLGKETKRKVHIPNTRNGRNMRIKTANSTATNDTQYFCL